MKKRKNVRGDTLQGEIFINSRGVGYVDINEEKDIQINGKDLNTALHKDLVEIKIKKNSGKGQVLRVLERARESFAGVLERDSSISRGQVEKFFFVPDDYRMYTNVLIPKNKLASAKEGQKVYVHMDPWEKSNEVPTGEVVKIFGWPGDNDAEMHAIAMSKGFAADLPTEVEKQAQEIKSRGIKANDYKNRRDFRNTMTFTIDPDDAKDFDDAISFKGLGTDKYEIGVHIADVSHFVPESSAIDKEARERGTSVYLVDRTIPMLPEVLSNDLCSLVPNQDRFTVSAIFEVDKNANVSKEWFGSTVIRSQKRLTYQQAQDSIEDKSKFLHSELFTLNEIAKKLTKERVRAGAMSIEESEVKFELDSTGKPTKVYKKERVESNKLIEEFMLLANKKIAKFLAGKDKKIKSLIYRVHDLPNKDRMAELALFLKSLGYKTYRENGIIPQKEINAILRNIPGENERDAVARAVIRSMAKAIYSTENIGHYGLSFEYYTHFTSPIRRYPDLMVHRILKRYLAGKKIAGKQVKEYKDIAKSSSERERDAIEAERNSIKYKQVEYMSERIGQKFEGIITGVSEMGMYIEEKETKSEGMVRMRDMKDDFYKLNEKRLEVVGERTKKRYRFGDEVKIKVGRVDLERKTIDYILV